MVAIRTLNPLPQQRTNLIKRMSGMYWRMARRERILCNIGTIIRDDLQIVPMQCSEMVKHLLSLRSTVQECQAFYSNLNPQDMKDVSPLGTLTKLGWLDEQVTELLLLISTLEIISTHTGYERVKLQLMIRRLYPVMLVNFDETTGHLAALVDKLIEREGWQDNE